MEPGAASTPHRPPGADRRWLWPAFGLAVAASIVLAIAAGWLAFQQLPALRHALDNERQLRERREAEARAATAARASQAQAPPQVQGNVPLLMLQATREAAGNAVAIPAGASQIVLWMETAATEPSFRVEVRTADRRLRHVIDGLRKNPYGALTVGLPATALEPGAYLIRLFAVTNGSTRLVQEYPLEVRPPP